MRKFFDQIGLGFTDEATPNKEPVPYYLLHAGKIRY